ncbi:hypothetical protein FHX48_001324 [Microbacterium halimionae]|uniref:Uncharacterized protein n=1 Tax=Microbacterium halimionae TaxID=1526413 RepID=A0A7W3PLQ7_9MICO|nr:hypothetical protein [Microbacterium halimionae]MBA8816251.1 hypothetical protein [Microbacterium halimionae]NII96453.1 hypothetical protein [Microbacterium halimionae]
MANPIDQLVQGGAEILVAQAVGGASGADVDIDVNGGSDIGPPDGWPGLPMPEGEVISAMRIDDSYSATILTADERTVEDTIADLNALGYAEVTTADLGGFKTVSVADDDLTILLSWFQDEENGGYSVSYSVVATQS